MLDNVRIYPNPATDQLMISINSPEIKDIIIDLVSVTGIIVYHNEFPSMNNPDYSIDIRNYEKGIYFLKIRSIKGQKIEKIVKQ